MSYIKFVLKCICNFIDGVVGRAGPTTPDIRQMNIITMVGGVLFVAFMFGTSFYLRHSKKINLKNVFELIVPIGVGIVVTLLYLAVVYWLLYT